jgi:uncharacterized protein (TIGR02145 family)
MKILISILILITSINLNAQNFMNIHKSDGTVVSIETSLIDSITYTTITQNNGGSTVVIDTTGFGPGLYFDGHMYQTVVIGNQEWMAENLQNTHFANGDTISEWWSYNGNDSLINTFGRLYNWFVTTDTRNVCPTGWHVPSGADFDTLTNFLGGNTVAGGPLKDTVLWQSPNTGSSNQTGFSATPAGYKYVTGFYNLTLHTGFWTTTDDGVNAYSRDLHFDNEMVTTGYNQKSDFMSIRCVKD